MQRGAAGDKLRRWGSRNAHAGCWVIPRGEGKDPSFPSEFARSVALCGARRFRRTPDGMWPRLVTGG